MLAGKQLSSYEIFVSVLWSALCNQASRDSQHEIKRRTRPKEDGLPTMEHGLRERMKLNLDLKFKTRTDFFLFKTCSLKLEGLREKNSQIKEELQSK